MIAPNKTIERVKNFITQTTDKKKARRNCLQHRPTLLYFGIEIKFKQLLRGSNINYLLLP